MTHDVSKLENINTIKKSNINSHVCSLCGHHESNCNEERHIETGFCTLYFSNFTSAKMDFHLDDSVKNYLNTQSIIF